jgi:hypothetical protein
MLFDWDARSNVWPELRDWDTRFMLVGCHLRPFPELLATHFDWRYTFGCGEHYLPRHNAAAFASNIAIHGRLLVSQLRLLKVVLARP